MKSTVLILLFTLTIQSNIFTQVYSKEYGMINQADADLTIYDADTTAEAVVLFDLGKSWFMQTDNGFDLMYERTTRIKILKEAGLSWAEIKIPIYQEGNIYERVISLEATTYNIEDGYLKKSMLNKSQKHEEIINKYWKADVFAMPEVKVGSIIEYKYQIQSEYIFKLRDWDFQTSIPTIYSKYETSMIPFYTYTYLLQGAKEFDEFEQYEATGITRRFGSIEFQDLIYTFGMKNLPAFKDEEFIVCEEDYITKLDFQLSKVSYPNGTIQEIMTTWPKLINDMMDDPLFGKYIKKSKQLSTKVINVDSLLLISENDRFDFVVNFVKNNYSWDQYNGKYANKSVKNFYSEKTGNSGAVNLFLCGMLQAVELNAEPVILSTRENGKIKYDYPFSHFFNYTVCIVNINGKLHLADATDPMTANNRLPIRCLNDKGLLIKDDVVHWIPLDCYYPSTTTTRIVTEIKNDSLYSKIRIGAKEYDALNLRKRIGNDIDKLFEYLQDNNYLLVDTSLFIKNAEHYKLPYQYSFKIMSHAEIMNDKIYLSPFLNQSILENPLKQKTRNYPMNMTYPKERILTSTFILPEGYSYYSVPYNRRIKNDLFEMEYKIFKTPKQLNVSCHYFLKKPVYEAENYDDIKTFFAEIVRKTNEKIVLVKENK